MIDRDTFFNGVRASLFGGSLSQSQVDGMNYLLNIWEAYFEQPNPRDGNKWLSYCMATVFHETAQKMQPIEEYGKGEGYAYGQPCGPYNQVYYGRGHVQLTWEDNYKKGQDQLKKNYGLDVQIWPKPELMLDDRPSALVLYDGMTIGWFTGVGLPKYFNATVEDPVNARRVVNGTDQASKIAGYYQKFKAAIVTAPEPAPPPDLPTVSITIACDQQINVVVNGAPLGVLVGSTASPRSSSYER
jgi:putative chitinase